MSTFFLCGDAKDPAYKNVRDLEHFQEYRDFVERLWSDYRGNEDQNFLSDAKAHFQQRFWEMYLWVSLYKYGLNPEKTSSSGPEFSIDIGGKRFWVEAICPTAGETVDAVPAEKPGEVFGVPVDKILLRFTGAMSAKLKKRHHDLLMQRIKPTDGYILAINSRAMPTSAWMGGEIPFVLKACFPIGNLALLIDKETGERGEAFYESQSQVEKANKSPVATGLLLDPEYSCFSAVIHSTVNCTSTQCPVGADFDFIRNPLAEIAIPSGVLQWAQHWEFNDHALHRIDRDLSSHLVQQCPSSN
jgi:hypothetical protein